MEKKEVTEETSERHIHQNTFIHGFAEYSSDLHNVEYQGWSQGEWQDHTYEGVPVQLVFWEAGRQSSVLANLDHQGETLTFFSIGMRVRVKFVLTGR